MLEVAFLNKNLLDDEKKRFFIRKVNEKHDFLFSKFEGLHILRSENEVLKKNKIIKKYI